MDPIFHMYEIVIGEGSNVSVSLIVFTKIVVLVIGFIIKKEVISWTLQVPVLFVIYYPSNGMTIEKLGPNLQFG